MSPLVSQYEGGSQQTFSVYGGTIDYGLGRVITSREYICSVDLDYASGGGVVEVIGDDGTHRLLNNFMIRGLSEGTCSFDLVYWNGISYARQSYSLSILRRLSEHPLGGGSSGGNYVGQTLNVPGFTQSGRVLSYVNTTLQNCSLAGQQVTLLKYGYCQLNYTAPATNIYKPYSGTYTIGVNGTLQHTLTLNVPTSLSIGSTPYPLSYSLTTPNGASELKPTFTVDNPSVCTVSEGPLLKQFRINLLAKGICTITASQSGNGAAYTASNNVVVMVTVTD